MEHYHSLIALVFLTKNKPCKELLVPFKDRPFYRYTLCAHIRHFDNRLVLAPTPIDGGYDYLFDTIERVASFVFYSSSFYITLTDEDNQIINYFIVDNRKHLTTYSTYTHYLDFVYNSLERDINYIAKRFVLNKNF